MMRECRNRRAPEKGEKHHIFPKSIYGENNTIVKLSYAEHIEAHRLLWLGCQQRYGEHHHYTIKMAKAYYSTTRNGKLNHEQAAAARAALSSSMKGKNNPMYGKPGTFLGKRHSDKSKQLLKDSKKKNHSATVQAARLGGIAAQSKKTTEERRLAAQKMGAATKGISKALGYKWYNNGNNEKKLPVAPLDEGWKAGRLPQSEETRKLKSVALKNRIFEIVKCPKCGKTGAKPVMKRFHFDKCNITLGTF